MPTAADTPADTPAGTSADPADPADPRTGPAPRGRLRAGSTSTSRALCLAAIRDLGEATVTDLATRTGLSRPTVEAALKRLATDRLIEHRIEQVLPGETGGRPARLSRFLPDRGVVAGVDVAGPQVRVVLRDLAGRRLHPTGDVPTVPSPTTDEPGFEGIRRALQVTLRGAGVDRARLRAVGVGIAGLLQRDGTVRSSPHVAGWRDTNLPHRLTAALNVPVTVDNDLSLAALAESEFGALHGTSIGVYVLTYHHVSSRVTIGGSVLRGRRNTAGEIGLHRAFTTDALPDGLFTDVVPRVGDELARLDDDRDDATGRAALAALVEAMTPAVTSLVLTVDPDVVVLGGTLARFAPHITPPLTAAVNASATHPLDVVVTGNALGDEAVAIGAAQSAFGEFSSEVYGTKGVPAPGYDPARVPDSTLERTAG